MKQSSNQVEEARKTTPVVRLNPEIQLEHRKQQSQASAAEEMLNLETKSSMGTARRQSEASLSAQSFRHYLFALKRERLERQN